MKLVSLNNSEKEQPLRLLFFVLFLWKNKKATAFFAVAHSFNDAFVDEFDGFLSELEQFQISFFPFLFLDKL